MTMRRGTGKSLKSSPVPSQGSSSRSDSCRVNGCALSTPFRLSGERHRALHIRLDGALGVGADLDRHLAGDVGSPLGRAGGDEFGSAGAEGREEGQDGDDGRERLAAGGIDRNQRRIAPEGGGQRSLARRGAGAGFRRAAMRFLTGRFIRRYAAGRRRARGGGRRADP